MVQKKIVDLMVLLHLPPGIGTPVDAFADGVSITTQQQQQQGPDTGPVYMPTSASVVLLKMEPYMVAGMEQMLIVGFCSQ